MMPQPPKSHCLDINMCGDESTSSSEERESQVDSFDRTRPSPTSTPTDLGHTDLSRKEAFNIAMNPFADPKLQSPAEAAIAATQVAVPGGMAVGAFRTLSLMTDGRGGKGPAPDGDGDGDGVDGKGKGSNTKIPTKPKASQSSRLSAKPQSRVAAAVTPSRAKLGRVAGINSTLLTGGRGVLTKANVSRKSLLGT